MSAVNFGSVTTFSPLPDARETMRKLVEESAEAFGAWERLRSASASLLAGHIAHGDTLAQDSEELALAQQDFLDELADVVQVVANLAALQGIQDMRPYMGACETRNRERGRIE